MSGFHEVRFPDKIAYGATGGPEFATTVVATTSGHEKRNVNWSEARGRWDVASGLSGPVVAARPEHARSVQPQLPGRPRGPPLQLPDRVAGAGRQQAVSEGAFYSVPTAAGAGSARYEHRIPR
jgi:hypothetical protein